MVQQNASNGHSNQFSSCWPPGQSLVYLPLHVVRRCAWQFAVQTVHLHHNQTDVKRISTAGGIERSTNDIKVSSHYEPCHSICITWRLNVNFCPFFFCEQISPPHSNFKWKLRYSESYLEACALHILPKAARRDIHEYSSVYKTLFPIGCLRKVSLKFNILLANHVVSICRFSQTEPKQTQSFFFLFFHSFSTLIVKLCSTHNT